MLRVMTKELRHIIPDMKTMDVADGHMTADAGLADKSREVGRGRDRDISLLP